MEYLSLRLQYASETGLSSPSLPIQVLKIEPKILVQSTYFIQDLPSDEREGSFQVVERLPRTLYMPGEPPTTPSNPRRPHPVCVGVTLQGANEANGIVFVGGLYHALNRGGRNDEIRIGQEEIGSFI